MCAGSVAGLRCASSCRRPREHDPIREPAHRRRSRASPGRRSSVATLIWLGDVEPGRGRPRAWAASVSSPLCEIVSFGFALEDIVMSIGGLIIGSAAIALAVVLGSASAPVCAQEPGPARVVIDQDDIGGVVSGPNGAEAGVWVIAETSDLPTKFARIVVTDEAGRYVIPDLPKAKYQVWARGYGLLDSPKLASEPGRVVNHTAAPARNAAEAAE